jgi:hypothetical protein
MAESAALLVAEVFPEQPVRQSVLSFPYPLRFLLASRPAIMGQVPGIVYSRNFVNDASWPIVLKNRVSRLVLNILARRCVMVLST